MHSSHTLVAAATLLLSAACQQQPAIQAPPAAALVPSGSAATASVAATETVAVPTALTATEHKFLADYNLADLLVMKESAGYELMNGFFGPDHYRIEFAMLEVKQDSTNPAHFYLKGKNRFKKTVLPFEGEMTITQLKNQPEMVVPKGEDSEGVRKYVKQQNQRTMYCAMGTFLLQEIGNSKGIGTFTGTVALDVEVDEEGRLQFDTRNREYGARGGQVLFAGTWTNQSTNQQKTVTLVQSIMSYQQDIFEEFTIGERDPDFNPKYAKLGWNTYWENDEWWAEPGQLTPRAEAPATVTADTSEVAAATSL